jgi:hypothetical protein
MHSEINALETVGLSINIARQIQFDAILHWFKQRTFLLSFVQNPFSSLSGLSLMSSNEGD